jgi:DNA-binding NarL/FixJ family response regulator
MDVRRVVLGERTFLLVSLPLRQDARTEALSPSQRAIARALVSGASNAMVARARATSVRTVANQVREILSRLRVGSRADVARTLAAVELVR